MRLRGLRPALNPTTSLPRLLPPPIPAPPRERLRTVLLGLRGLKGQHVLEMMLRPLRPRGGEYDVVSLG